MTKQVKDLGPEDIGKVVVVKYGSTVKRTIIGTLESVNISSYSYANTEVKVSGTNYEVPEETDIWVEDCGITYDAYKELQQLAKKVQTT